MLRTVLGNAPHMSADYLRSRVSQSLEVQRAEMPPDARKTLILPSLRLSNDIVDVINHFVRLVRVMVATLLYRISFCTMKAT